MAMKTEAEIVMLLKLKNERKLVIYTTLIAFVFVLTIILFNVFAHFKHLKDTNKVHVEIAEMNVEIDKKVKAENDKEKQGCIFEGVNIRSTVFCDEFIASEEGKQALQKSKFEYDDKKLKG